MIQLREAAQVVKFTQSRELNLTAVPKTSVLSDYRLDRAKKLYRKNLLQHYGCVNAIEFSNDGRLLASAGDDRRILLWDVHRVIHRQGQSDPIVMQAEHRSNVFVVAIDSTNSKIFSGGNDDQVIVHDVTTGKPLDYFLHDEPVYGISIDPLNDNLFVTACDNGQLQIHDIRDSTPSPFCLATASSAYHAVMFNPVEPRLIVSANTKTGVTLWDVRMPNVALLNYGGKSSEQCCMSARFNRDGSKIIALRRRLPPILYATHSTNHLFQFNHSGYYNSCTMKSCSFAGSDDQFVVSGSDNFDLYMWKIPTESSSGECIDTRLVHNAQLVLRGHRSIVNQVRYNPNYSILASSGVEKVIKFWSPFPLPSPNAKSIFETFGEYDRRIYTNNDYINLILQSGQFLSLTYDTNRRTTREDPRMLAFFDALVQRDIEGMSDQEDDLSMSSTQPETLARNISSWAVDHPLPADEDEEEGAAVPQEIETINIDGSDDDGEVGEGGATLRVVVDPVVIDIEQSSSNESSSTAPASTSSDVTSTLPQGTAEEPNCITSHENSRGTSKASSGRDENDEGDCRSPDLDEMRTNAITKLIAQKHLQLIRMARNHVRLESEGKPKLKRKHMTLLDRLKRLNRKTHSLTMNLLPFPEPASSEEEDYSPSGSTTSSTSSSSSSSTSSSSSSSGSDHDDDHFLELRKKVKPLLINASTSTTALPEDSPLEAAMEEPEEQPTPAPPQSRSGSRTSTSQRTIRHLVRKKKQIPPEVEHNDDQPCTSATALRRQGIISASRTESKTKDNESSSCSSSSSTDTSDRADFITRLEEVSKRLKRVSNDLSSSSSLLRSSKYNPRRKQQSTMIRSPTSSSLSSTSTSSTSTSSSSSDSEDITSKLPPPPKRRKISNEDTKTGKTESGGGVRGEDEEEKPSTSREGRIRKRQRKPSTKYRGHKDKESSDEESD